MICAGAVSAVLRRTIVASAPNRQLSTNHARSMGFYEQIEEFGGYPVRDFKPDLPLAEPEKTVYRLTTVPRMEEPYLQGFSCLVTLISFLIAIVVAIAYQFVAGVLTFVAASLANWAFVSISRFVRAKSRQGWYCPYCDERLASRYDEHCVSCQRAWGADARRPSQPPPIAAQLSRFGRLGKLLADYLSDPSAGKSVGLIFSTCASYEDVGPGNESVWETVCLASEALPNVEHLFIGEMTQDQAEVSWMEQGDLTGVIKSFPNLKELWIRGADFHFSPIHSTRLETIVLQSGGLGKRALQGLLKSQLPNLTHLEVWTGSSMYEGECELDDLLPLFERPLFPKLARLGICNCEFADEVAERIAATPWLSQLKVLDLSLGTLSHEGAQFLLKMPWLHQLELLDIHHHFLTPELVRQFEQTGVIVNADEPQLSETSRHDDGELERYCAVAE